ncbi:MAG: bifunctional folylpolyglutamate synthase/dihydrofolate synthase, partial [Rhodocyclaceae bacterium]|nr:bifunctional folylpolyglutamate synthase/dihydrofolate synthase [Rhodocyclaceae bacterium]
MDDWLAHIERQHSQPIALGLERVRVVQTALGRKQTCPVIVVGGTNGKGSTCAMLERILLCAGYRVGLYTSPHLLRYNERVRIDGRAVPDEAL